MQILLIRSYVELIVGRKAGALLSRASCGETPSTVRAKDRARQQCLNMSLMSAAMILDSWAAETKDHSGSTGPTGLGTPPLGAAFAAFASADLGPHTHRPHLRHDPQCQNLSPDAANERTISFFLFFFFQTSFVSWWSSWWKKWEKKKKIFLPKLIILYSQGLSQGMGITDKFGWTVLSSFFSSEHLCVIENI